jgi:hypothetical protein
MTMPTVFWIHALPISYDTNGNMLMKDTDNEADGTVNHHIKITVELGSWKHYTMDYQHFTWCFANNIWMYCN